MEEELKREEQESKELLDGKEEQIKYMKTQIDDITINYDELAANLEAEINTYKNLLEGFESVEEKQYASQNLFIFFLPFKLFEFFHNSFNLFIFLVFFYFFFNTKKKKRGVEANRRKSRTASQKHTAIGPIFRCFIFSYFIK